ncbi:MAG TPA: sensor domain-containing diguanylate cyclase [Acidimicrobiales bacterium]|nr:sensor domain-containing diguanylate cyclase [Acidimicrobiales bacterium]
MAEHELRDKALRALLVQYPDALVGGIREDGLFVPLPPSVPVAGHRSPQARSALDLVHPGDRAKVISGWEQARDDGDSEGEGVGQMVVRMAGDTDARGIIHIADVRATHGVRVAVIVPLDDDGTGPLDDAAAIESPPPRLVRTHKDGLAVLVHVEPEIMEILGWEPSELLGRRMLDLIHPDDHETAINAWMELLAKPGSTNRIRARHQHRDGRWVWVEISNRNLLEDPDAGYVDSEMLDISEEMGALDALRASEQLLRRLAGALPVGVVHLDPDQRLVYANEKLHQIVGASPARLPRRLSECAVEQDVLDAALGDALAGTDVDVELHIDPFDGGPRRRCTIALRALTTDEGVVTGAVGCVTDVTDASRMRAELEYRAMTDELTGCVNRATAMAALDRALESSAGDTAVVFVDLDRFKAVNDRFGHAVGDGLLAAIAARIRAVVRAGDVVGRVGGDEFLIVCPNVADRAHGMALAERVVEAIARPFSIEGVKVHTSASVGLAWAADAEDADALIARADDAMYRSKRAGGRRAVLAETADSGVTIVDELGPHLERLHRPGSSTR